MKYLSVAQAAKRLEVHPMTVRRWIWADKLLVVRTLTNRIKIPVTAIEHLELTPGYSRKQPAA